MTKHTKSYHWPSEFNNVIRQLRQAVRFVWQSGPSWTIANVVIFVLQGILPLLALYIMKLVIDEITVIIKTPNIGNDFTHIGLLIGIEGLIALFIALSNVIARWIGDLHAEVITDHMHNIIHGKSVEVDLEYYENSKYHDTFHRSLKESSYRPSKILRDLLSVGKNGASVIAMASLLFYLHWAIGLILFIAFVPGIFIRIKYAGIEYQWKRGRTPTERKAWYFHWMMTRDSFAKEIRLFDLGKMFMNKYKNIRTQLREERRVITTKRAITEGSSQFFTTIAIFGSYAFIAHQTVQGAITMGDLILYYEAFKQGQSFFREMLGGLANLYEDSLFLSDLFEFLSLERKLIEPEYSKQVPKPIKTGIVFDNISFQYPTETSRTVLHKVNFRVRPGETIALVGENGSGKTTLIKLLCRLYDPTYGSISIDGIDLRNFKIMDLRKEFSVIFQDFACFHLTAKENIAMSNIPVSSDIDGIKRAALNSGIDPVITKLKQGYDTILGKWFEEGEELSIGEWQKVALARALFRNAQIIILDEPTSSLDAKAEYELFKKFHKLSSGRTTIVISHRLLTVRMADSIYFLENGRIIEMGSHEELIHLGNKYAEMFEMQSEAYSTAYDIPV